MTLTDFDSIRDEVQKWCARSDTTFSNRFESFLTLAEDRIYQGAGVPGDPLYTVPLRSKVMVKSDTITVTDGEGDIPADCLEIRSLHPADQTFGIEYLPPERFAVLATTIGGSYPTYFTVEGDKLKIAPTFSGSVTIVYFQRFTAISSDNTTGELIEAHPAVYFSACMFEAYSFMEEPETALGHLARYRSQVAGANDAARGVRYGAQARRIRPRVAIS